MVPIAPVRQAPWHGKACFYVVLAQHLQRALHRQATANGSRQTAVGEEPLEGGNGGVLAGGFEGLARQQEARRLVCDRQGVAVSAVVDFELALEVGALQIVGREGH